MNTKDLLISVIRRSEVIEKEQKEEFIALVPILDNKQIEKTLKLFLEAEEEIEKSRNEVKQKRSQIYTSCFSEIDVIAQETKKILHKNAERESRLEEGKERQIMLNEVRKM